MRVPKVVLLGLFVGAFFLFIYAIRDQPTRTVTKTVHDKLPIPVTKTHTVVKHAPAVMPKVCTVAESETSQLAKLTGDSEGYITELEDAFESYHEQLVTKDERMATKTLQGIIDTHEKLSNNLVTINELKTQLSEDQDSCKQALK